MKIPPVIAAKQKIYRKFLEAIGPITHPVCYRNTKTNKVVLISGLCGNRTLTTKENWRITEWSNSISEYENISDWVQVPYDKEAGFCHNQIAYSWDNISKHGRAIRFYDAVNRCIGEERILALPTFMHKNF